MSMRVVVFGPNNQDLFGVTGLIIGETTRSLTLLFSNAPVMVLPGDQWGTLQIFQNETPPAEIEIPARYARGIALRNEILE